VINNKGLSKRGFICFFSPNRFPCPAAGIIADILIEKPQLNY